MSKVTETVDNILNLRLVRDHLRGEDLQRLDGVLQSLRDSLGETISKSAAADLLGVSRQTLDRWIQEGIVPVVQRASGRQQVLVSSLERRLLDLRDLREKGLDGKVLPSLRVIYKGEADSGEAKSSQKAKKASAKKTAAASKKASAKKPAASAKKSSAKKAASRKATVKPASGTKRVPASEKKAVPESEKKREHRSRKSS